MASKLIYYSKGVYRIYKMKSEIQEDKMILKEISKLDLSILQDMLIDIDDEDLNKDVFKELLETKSLFIEIEKI